MTHDHHARLVVRPDAHGVNRKFAGLSFGDIKGRLTVVDDPTGHEKMNIGPGSDVKLFDQIHLGPTRNRPGKVIYDCSHEPTCTIIQ